ncbi:unnamed protein product [Vicia faba]|uniref:Uncharacterized protein n=1 Tax=Vicia faba TaxID=3906 RepID=A0AAV0YLC3_VICFA|nr:unnamed protein product [Vicia faba]
MGIKRSITLIVELDKIRYILSLTNLTKYSTWYLVYDDVVSPWTWQSALEQDMFTRFGNLSMGKEMGNNNTSAIKEEDNTSEVDNKKLVEDTSEHANQMLREENKKVPTSSLTKDIQQDVHDADGDVKGKKTQTISIAEANVAYEINLKNQMHPKAEVKNVKEKATTELGQVVMQEEIRGGGVEEKTKSISTAIFANGGYETRDSVTRLSTESNPDNLNITSQMQKSPSFNLNLRTESRGEESVEIPLLCKSASDSLSNKLSQNLSNSMPHDEYDHIEEKIVTMERSYSEMSNSSFISFPKEEAAADLLVMEHTQDNNAGSKMEVLSSTSPKGKEKGKSMSYFFTSCMCCATLPN